MRPLHQKCARPGIWRKTLHAIWRTRSDRMPPAVFGGVVPTDEHVSDGVAHRSRNKPSSRLQRFVYQRFVYSLKSYCRLLIVAELANLQQHRTFEEIRSRVRSQFGPGSLLYTRLKAAVAFSEAEDTAKNFLPTRCNYLVTASSYPFPHRKP